MDKEGHLTKEERAAYWARTLAPAALLAASEHLQTCAWCREQLGQGRPPAGAESALEYDELVAFMEGALDPLEREEMARRLAACPTAAAELAELAQFREEMNQLPPRNHALAEEEANPRSGSWLRPIAAGLALGLAFLWWSSTEQSQSRGLALRDAGKQIVLRADGSVPALGPLPRDLEESLQEASLGKIQLPAAVVSLQSSVETLAGPPASESGGFAVVAPVGTFVETARPTFQWNAAPAASGYRVNLAPKSGGEVISSPLLAPSRRSWTPDETLQPDEAYDWEVEALRAGEMLAKAPAPPAPAARFAILPNEKRERLKELRRRFGRSHLVMGLAYAEAGLLPQARAELEALARENSKSALPKKLLASLRMQEHP